MGFLDDLPGIRNLENADGEAVPRRATLRIVGPGVSLEDDPVEGETILTIDPYSASGATITPPEIEDTTNNYNPTGWDTAFIVRLSGEDQILSGFEASDYPKLLVNVGGFDLTISHQGGGSSAANRVITPSGSAYTFAAGEIVELFYDTTVTRWRLVRP